MLVTVLWGRFWTALKGARKHNKTWLRESEPREFHVANWHVGFVSIIFAVTKSRWFGSLSVFYSDNTPSVWCMFRSCLRTTASKWAINLRLLMKAGSLHRLFESFRCFSRQQVAATHTSISIKKPKVASMSLWFSQILRELLALESNCRLPFLKNGIRIQTPGREEMETASHGALSPPQSEQCSSAWIEKDIFETSIYYLKEEGERSNTSKISPA